MVAATRSQGLVPASWRRGDATPSSPSQEEADFTAAFAELLPRCARVAYRLLGDRAAAEDIAAEALGRAFARWSVVRALPYRDAWVLRVTTNLALNVLARRKPEPLPPGSVDVEDLVVTRVALGAALAELPRRQRQIIVLRHIGGLSEAEIAQVLGIGQGTVKTHTRRALAALRARLGDEFRGAR